MASNVLIWHDTAEPPHPRCQRFGYSVLDDEGRVVVRSECKYNNADHAKAAARGDKGSNVSRRKDGSLSARAIQYNHVAQERLGLRTNKE
jgi:hypothetical protein